MTSVLHRDTIREAAEVQAAVQERLGGAARLRLAYEMSAMARGLALAGLRARLAAASREELLRMLHSPPGGAIPPRFPPPTL